MKRLTIMLAAALVFAVGSAFTNALNNELTDVADAWFELKPGVAPTLVNARVASNYQLTDADPCGDGETYCGVQANNVSGQPDISSGSTARSQIETYFASGIEGNRIAAKN